MASWVVLVAIVLLGGFDPRPRPTWLLRGMGTLAVAAAVAGVWLSVVGLARGPQRNWATLGFVLSLCFIVTFFGVAVAD